MKRCYLAVLWGSVLETTDTQLAGQTGWGNSTKQDKPHKNVEVYKPIYKHLSCL